MPEHKMKQVIVHYEPKDLRSLGYDDLFVSMERFTVVSVIALMPEKTALLVVIKWRKGEDLSWLEGSPLIDDTLDMGPVHDGHMYLLMGSEEPWFFDMLRKIMDEFRVFINLPVVLEPDRIIIRYIGFMENLQRIIELSKEFNPDFEVISMKDYDPSRKGAFEVLTPVQYDILTEAFKGGFFDDRRKVTINELARERGISPASYMKTLRRAQRKLIGEMISAQ